MMGVKIIVKSGAKTLKVVFHVATIGRDIVKDVIDIKDIVNHLPFGLLIIIK